MHAIRRILVAIKDPKAESLPAVDKAAQLARAFGARLELFHSISTPLYIDALNASNSYLAGLEKSWRAELNQQLEAVAGRVSKHGVKTATHVQWDYPVFEAILRRAKRIKADLIVVSAHEGEHRAAGLLRLTDWELLRLSPIPVLLVKSAKPYKNPVVLAAIDPMHTFAKPTRLDGEILKAGQAFRAALRGTLHAVHAYVPMIAGIPPSDYLKPNVTQSLEAKAKDLVRSSFEREVRAASIAPARRHLVGEHPIDAIPDTARKVGSAIVVMGAISRSGLKRFFIGNTAEQLLDKMECDVLIVKPLHFKSRRIPSGARGARLVAAQPMIA
jgi:universal stress protein E